METNSINLEVINELKSLDEETSSDLLKQIAQLYLDGFNNVYAELKLAATEGNLTKISQIAHSFKSSSANLGALRMCDLFTELERRARLREDIQNLNPIINELKIEFDQIKGFYGQFIQ